MADKLRKLLFALETAENLVHRSFDVTLVEMGDQILAPLDQEMARKDWLIHPASIDLVFHPKPGQLWKEILRQKDDKSRLLAESPDDLSWN